MHHTYQTGRHVLVGNDQRRRVPAVSDDLRSVFQNAKREPPQFPAVLGNRQFFAFEFRVSLHPDLLSTLE